MKNKWTYSTLSEAEKLKMISEGNKDLYKTEMENAKAYLNLLASENLETKGAKNYIRSLKDAVSASKKSTSSSKNWYTQDFIDEFNNNFKNLEKQYTDTISELEKEQKKTVDYLSEWLVNNGYSLDGNYGAGRLGEVKSAYSKEIDRLKKEYDENIKYYRSLVGY